MGNSCACINDDQKDREEFRHASVSGSGVAVAQRMHDIGNENEAVVFIQKNYRAHKARKLYSEMKKEVGGAGG